MNTKSINKCIFVGRGPHKTYLDQLKDDVILDIGDMANAMKDREVWKRIVTNA